jgi:hypothetical protein
MIFSEELRVVFMFDRFEFGPRKFQIERVNKLLIRHVTWTSLSVRLTNN